MWESSAPRAYALLSNLAFPNVACLWLVSRQTYDMSHWCSLILEKGTHEVKRQVLQLHRKKNNPNICGFNVEIYNLTCDQIKDKTKHSMRCIKLLCSCRVFENRFYKLVLSKCKKRTFSICMKHNCRWKVKISMKDYTSSFCYPEFWEVWWVVNLWCWRCCDKHTWVVSTYTAVREQCVIPLQNKITATVDAKR